MQLLPSAQLAQSLNVTPRRVHQLVREGMPKAERGRYDLTACLEWYVRFLQRAVERREDLNGNGTSDAVRRERTRLLQAQAERAERENRVASGELVPLADFTRMTSAMVLHARQRLLQLPARVAPQLEGETQVCIKAKLTREVHAALTGLAVSESHAPCPELDNPLSADTSTPGGPSAQP